MNTLTRSLTVAALFAASGAMLATAQVAPDGTTAPAVRTEGPAADAPDARVVPAQMRDGRDDRRGRHGRHGGGQRGALLGAFGPAGAEALFAAVDADGDGRVTQAEVDAYLDAQVAGADADTDGALALEEFAPVYFEQMRPRMVDAFQALDEDGSGTVTAEELDARFGGAVARFDRDGDDALTLQDGRRGRD